MPFEPRKPHKKILDALYRHQVLTTELVVGAVGSMKSASTVKPYIQTLEKHNYLARFPLYPALKNSVQVCVLAEQGMKHLRDEHGYAMKFYRPPSEWKSYSTEYLMHPLERNKIVIAGSKIGGYDPRIKLLKVEFDYELQSNPLQAIEVNGVVHRVVNDIILQFTVGLTPDKRPKRRIILVVFVNDIGDQFRIRNGAIVSTRLTMIIRFGGQLTTKKGDPLTCANEKGSHPLCLSS